MVVQKSSLVKYGLFLISFILMTSIVFIPSRFPVQSQNSFTPTPTVSLQTIESDALSVIRQGDWLSQNASRASGGSYLYSGGSADDSLTLYFSGSSIEISYVTHSSLGTLAIEIDNTVVRTLFTNTDRVTYNQRTVINALPEGPHILQVYAVQGVVAVDAFVTKPLQTNSPDPIATQSSVMFIPNEGQYEPHVQFEANGGGLFALYESNRASFFIPVRPSAADDRSARTERQEIPFSQVFQGASTTPIVTGINRQPGVVNYLVGNDPAEWHTDLPIYGGIVYQNLYPNIDLYFTDATGLTNGEFILKPGADINNIRWQYEGVSNLRLDQTTGQLTFEIANPNNLDVPLLPQSLTMRAWQMSNGQPQPVTIDYVLNTDGTVGLRANNYDATRSLTMQAGVGEDEMGTAASIAFPDLASFSYSTYVSGSGTEKVNDIAVDASGNAYVVGSFGQHIRKYDANGVLVYTTVLGSSFLNSVVVDDTGRAYVTGSTSLPNFPTSPNAYQSSESDCIDLSCTEVVVARLNAAGNSVEYGTYLGGNRSEDAYGIAIQDGRIYVTGYTRSFDFDISLDESERPVVIGKEAFITKLNPALSGTAQLEFSFTFGGRTSAYWGDYDDYSTGIAVDAGGNVYVTGHTETTDFYHSVSGVYQSSCVTHQAPNPLDNFEVQTRCTSGFITKFRPVAPNTLETQASTFFGGNADDIINDVAIDSEGFIYVVGSTDSTSGLFSSAFGYDASFNGGNTYSTGEGRPEGGDAFLAKFAPNLGPQDLVYATYLGGSGDESGYGIAVNAGGIATITGTTYSTDFPLSSNPLQTGLLGYRDVFLTRLDTTTSGSTSLLYSTYIGGTTGEVGYSVATDNNFAFYVAGETDSADFPVVNASQDTYGGGGWDGFAFRAPIGCVDDLLVRTVGIYPGKPQWATDLDGQTDRLTIETIANDSTGLVIYQAPAINASPLTDSSGAAARLNWGEPTCVTGRIAYERPPVPVIGPNTPTPTPTATPTTPQEPPYREVWYRVTTTLGEGWILARMDTATTSYIYIADWVATDYNAVSILSDPAVNANPPQQISFLYDGERAALYASENSIRNFYNHTQLAIGRNVPTGAYGGQVTIDDPLFQGYAEMNGQEFGTGSSAFTSQSIWHGGLPMTTNGDDYCSNDNGIGWRYCPNQNLSDRTASYMWTDHNGIINSWVALGAGEALPVFREEGESEDTIGLPTNKFNFDVGFRNDSGIVTAFDYTETETRRRAIAFVQRYRLDRVIAGDYLFINTGVNTQGSTHGLLVVGWGPLIDCTEVTLYEDEILSPSQNQPFLTERFTYNSDPNASYDPDVDKFVPYVADFAYSSSRQWRQYIGPRPFYCTKSPHPNEDEIAAGNSEQITDPNQIPDVIDNFNHDMYRFHRAPSIITISPSSIYAPNFSAW